MKVNKTELVVKPVFMLELSAEEAVLIRQADTLVTHALANEKFNAETGQRVKNLLSRIDIEFANVGVEYHSVYAD